MGTLYHAQSPYQTIDIIDTKAYGRMLLLDGKVMTTERDEFIYHEMLAHIPLMAYASTAPPQHVVIIGGGDGGTVREVLKHPSVQRVVLCEIDADVIEACRQFLPGIAGKIDDARVDRRDGDGVAYVKQLAQEAPGTVDVFLIDATDPLGPGEGLFTEPFYENVRTCLTEGGVVALQSESPWAQQRAFQLIQRTLREVFPIVQPYVAAVPTYPGGYWSWTFCSMTKDGRKLAPTTEALAADLEKQCRFYNRHVHGAVFALPNFVRQLASL
jgi:spermidine synthase